MTSAEALAGGAEGAGRAALQLISKLRWQVADSQAAAVLVELNLGAEQVRLEADRQTLCSTGVAPELVQGALVRSEAFHQAVVPGLDKFGEGCGSIFIEHLHRVVRPKYQHQPVGTGSMRERIQVGQYVMLRGGMRRPS
jgi:hypothetical protein